MMTLIPLNLQNLVRPVIAEGKMRQMRNLLLNAGAYFLDIFSIVA